MQDARLIDGKLYLAAYGLLGILDLKQQTWHGQQSDFPLELNRIGPVRGADGRLFVGYDEGGASGGSVEWTRGKETGHVRIAPAFHPNDLLGFGGRIFVSTDKGLAEITDPAGEAIARHFIDQHGTSPLGETTALVPHGKTLLAVAGDRILQLDPVSRTATLHQLPQATKVSTICRFDGHFYGLGPGPLARFDIPADTSARPPR
jgi:hypothetical protein